MNRRQRQRRVRIKRAIAMAPLAVVAVALMVGLVLPAELRVRSVHLVATSPDALFAVLTDLDAMPTWRRDLDALERMPDADGIVRWQETAAGGRRTALARPVARAGRIEVEVADSRLPRRWTYQWRPVAGGTELTVTEATVLRNPFRRTFVRLFGQRRGRLDQWFHDLDTRIGGRRTRLAQASARGA